MKRILVLVVALLLVIPFNVKAYSEDTKYNTLGLKEALEVEELEEEFEEYEETDDQVTIYLFRRDGCYYCRGFLSFLNSIADEYGKYFKLVSYEVSTDQQNSELFAEVSKFKDGQEATGVPYIVIGDQVFGGYAEDYDQSILAAIMNLYNTPKEDRYDVLYELAHQPNHDTTVAVISIAVVAAFVGTIVYTRKKVK